VPGRDASHRPRALNLTSSGSTVPADVRDALAYSLSAVEAHARRRPTPAGPNQTSITATTGARSGEHAHTPTRRSARFGRRITTRQKDRRETPHRSA